MFFFISVFGLIIGSFLNALIHRLHTQEAIWERHSRCPYCGHSLKWFELIPLVSFFVLRRRCRYCRKPISWQYPAVEMATAVAFLLIFNFQFFSLREIFTTIFNLIFACFLIVIFVYDLKHYLILDKVVFPAVAVAVAYQIWQNNFWNGFWGALILAGFFGLLYLSSRGRWIGFGDLKLGIFLGFLIPWPQTLILFLLAYVLGAVISLGLMISGLKNLKDPLPFGTFLTLAAFLAMLWGEEMTKWYLELIGI